MQDLDTPPGSATTVNESTYDPTRTLPKEEEEGLEGIPTPVKKLWKFHLRPAEDSGPQDWWFASTAIPLLAATTGPLANVMSIAALVTSWRSKYDLEHPNEDQYSIGFPDPRWCVALNAASLVCGCAGNIFLLFNFTKRVRYIIALPMTIILWYFATGILMAITISMNEYVPPMRPEETYSQGFWHAVIASVLYLCSSMLLMVNMLGYFLGHYPQHFELSDEQRNLILQTMMFFIWLAAAGAIFAKVCGWNYADALYFADVTILTVGFGDFTAPNDAGRGLVFPFSVGGIIILGLMVNSIRKFAQELGHDKVVKKHVESRRIRTLERSVQISHENERNHDLERGVLENRLQSISAPFNPRRRTIAFENPLPLQGQIRSPKSSRSFSLKSPLSPLKSPASTLSNMSKTVKHIRPPFSPFKRSRKAKLLILREEKDRFNAMRGIQYSTRRFKRYSALTMSIIAFGLLWCVGAVVFWRIEQKSQNLSYFQALYFCYVSLLTIGYGDLAPKSNAGKPFFIVWSLIAVPTMTILISDMSDTVVASYKRGTFTLAAWTVLPEKGFFRAFVEAHPRLLRTLQFLQHKSQQRAAERRISAGFRTGPPADDDDHQDDDLDPIPPPPTLEALAEEEALDEHALARRLALAIRRTSNDLKTEALRRYTYEEWVEYTRLIRFTRRFPSNLEEEEEEEGIVEWDWIGENSPMLAEESEAEWLLDRLCESLGRYMQRQLPRQQQQQHVRARERERQASRVEDGLSYYSRREERERERDGWMDGVGKEEKEKEKEIEMGVLKGKEIMG